MIRSKPSTDAYRDAWDRVFAEAAEEQPTLADLIESECAAAHAAAEAKERAVYQHGYGWPTEHEADCPFLRGESCRCPMGNL